MSWGLDATCSYNATLAEVTAIYTVENLGPDADPYVVSVNSVADKPASSRVSRRPSR